MNGQRFLRLADGRGWAFTVSSKDGEILCEKMQEDEIVEADEAAPEAQEPEEGAEPGAEPEAENEQ